MLRVAEEKVSDRQHCGHRQRESRRPPVHHGGIGCRSEHSTHGVASTERPRIMFTGVGVA